MVDDELQVPKLTSGDAVHSLAKAGLSTIPIIGGATVELFQNVVQPPLEKRRTAWMQNVGNKLHELENKGLNLEMLQGNEQFISAVMRASQAALHTHQELKLASLRNAIINIAKGQAPDEAMQHLFLDFVDSLTELHLQILKLFQEPVPPPGMSMGGLSCVLEHNMPQLSGRDELYNQLWKDLYSRGLVNTDGMNTTMSERGLAQKRTTGLGDSLLSFISETD